MMMKIILDFPARKSGICKITRRASFLMKLPLSPKEMIVICHRVIPLHALGPDITMIILKLKKRAWAQTSQTDRYQESLIVNLIQNHKQAPNQLI